MPDMTLSDGREITFDLMALSLTEFRALFDSKQPQVEADAILARVAGMTLEEYGALPYLEWRRLTIEFFKKSRNPLADPNSASESTST